MTSRAVYSPLVLAFALAFAGAAEAAEPKAATSCPEGQARVKGACVTACATAGVFSDPHACECPAGYGKILLGNGGGECRRLVCHTDAVIDPALCDCPQGFAPKAVKKGQARCMAAIPSPAAK